MEQQTTFELAPLFEAVGKKLQENQEALNQADPYNGDHGDHMVEIFQIAVGTAEEMPDAPMVDVIETAGQRLEENAHNGSAQVYAGGLKQFAEQFRHYQVSLDDLLPYVWGILADDKSEKSFDAEGSTKAGEVLKALVAGLSGWQQSEEGDGESGHPLSMGALFELGMAYLQAKKRGGSRVEVLADAAASASPLSGVPHRYQSGKMAIQALLQAMQDQADAACAG